MVSTRWWVKNKILIEMILSSILIFCFVFGFTKPNIFLIIMLVFTILYAVYIFIFISWTKRRFKIFIMIGIVLFIGILVCIYGLTSSIDKFDVYDNYSKAYSIFVVLLCSIFCVAIIV